MKYNISRPALTIYLLLAGISLYWCVYRDLQIEKQYTSDLRNRIVGARLQKDGKSPYFYHWNSSDGLRYYDHSNNSSSLKISNITATPFFHQLLYPISDLPQRTISKIWLVFEYFALFLMTIIALKLAKQQRQKWTVLFTSLLFLYSYAWTTNVAAGQLYIFIPLLAMLFYFFITLKASLLNAAFAGICAMTLILIRPNTLLFLFPFLFLANRYSKRYKVVFLFCSCSVLLLAVSSSQSRLYWSDYRKAINENIKMHQGITPVVGNNRPIPKYENWEGWSAEQIKKDSLLFPYKNNGENGNVFVFLNLGLHVKTPIWVLSVLCISFAALLVFIFYKKIWQTPQFNTYSIALIGFCVYMASDIFSPIHRFLQNASQWIFPLLITASVYSTSFKKIYIIGILLGLLLNSLSISLLPMQATIGEYIIYASILGLLFTFKVEAKK